MQPVRWQASAHIMSLVLLRGVLGSAAINLLYISLLWLPMKVRDPGCNSNALNHDAAMLAQQMAQGWAHCSMEKEHGA